jgi:two-component system response regulator NreC
VPSSLRILVADDNEMIRNSLCAVLEAHSGWIVCGRAVDGTDAVQKAAELKPDVILLDVSMPGLNGFEAAECIQERVPNAEILVVTEQESSLLDHLPRLPGVRGYVVKSRIASDFISAVEAASKHRPMVGSTTA